MMEVFGLGHGLEMKEGGSAKRLRKVKMSLQARILYYRAR
jgi:hypothetical protein